VLSENTLKVRAGNRGHFSKTEKKRGGKRDVPILSWQRGEISEKELGKDIYELEDKKET